MRKYVITLIVMVFASGCGGLNAHRVKKREVQQLPKHDQMSSKPAVKKRPAFKSSDVNQDNADAILREIYIPSGYEIVEVGWERRGGLIHFPHKAYRKVSDGRFFFEDNDASQGVFVPYLMCRKTSPFRTEI